MERDPRQYRLYALQCAEMASRARTPELRTGLLELGAQWTRLARSFEAAEGARVWLADDQDTAVGDAPVEPLGSSLLH